MHRLDVIAHVDVREMLVIFLWV